jgi:hypothetical protein
MVGLVSLTAAVPALAINFDVSSVSVSSFAPNPIQIGARPTLFGYSFRWDKQGGAATINLNISASLSSNAIYGDSDDISIGNTVTSQSFSGSGGTSTITHSSASGLGFLQVPSGSAVGEYYAFVNIAPVGPIYVDPDSNDAFGTRPWKVRVTTEPTIVGDFNGDGAVGAADYVVWRKNNGSTQEFNAWRANFGNTVGSGTSQGASEFAGSVPEPGACVLFAFAAAIALVAVRRRHCASPSDLAIL